MSWSKDSAAATPWNKESAVSEGFSKASAENTPWDNPAAPLTLLNEQWEEMEELRWSDMDELIWTPLANWSKDSPTTTTWA